MSRAGFDVCPSQSEIFLVSTDIFQILFKYEDSANGGCVRHLLTLRDGNVFFTQFSLFTSFCDLIALMKVFGVYRYMAKFSNNGNDLIAHVGSSAVIYRGKDSLFPCTHRLNRILSSEAILEVEGFVRDLSKGREEIRPSYSFMYDSFSYINSCISKQRNKEVSGLRKYWNLFRLYLSRR